MVLRYLMEAEMYRNIGDPNGSSRYGKFFYTPLEELTKRERKFNAKAIENGKINLQTLATLDSVAFLDAYRIYSRRFNTWM